MVGTPQEPRAGRRDRLALKTLALAVALAAASAALASPSPRPREYWVGSSFRNLPAGRHAENPSTPTFVYGKCVPTPQGGCLPPLQVQNWHLSRRHPSRYVRAIRCIRGTIKRVPAAVFQTTGGLEVYAGRTVIFVVARQTADVMRAARALRPYGAERNAIRLTPPPSSVTRALRRCRSGDLRQALEASG